MQTYIQYIYIIVAPFHQAHIYHVGYTILILNAQEK
jgi:hypothetical protein